MKSKYIFLIAAIILLFTGMVFYLLSGRRILVPEDYKTTASYVVWIGEEPLVQPPFPGSIVIPSDHEIAQVPLINTADVPFVQKIVDANAPDLQLARKIADLKFSFSPTKNINVNFKKGIVLYSATLKDGASHDYYVVAVQIELSGKILKSFPQGLRYVPLDEAEFRDSLTKEIQSRIGAEEKFVVMEPVPDDDTFWGVKPWQLKKLPE